MAAGVFMRRENAARGWARLHGVWSDRFGHLYAESTGAREALPELVRGTGILRGDSTTPYPELALLAPSQTPELARILRGWDELAGRLEEGGYIYQGEDGRWHLDRL